MSSRILRDPESNVPWPAKKRRKERKCDVIKKQKVSGEAHFNHKGVAQPATWQALFPSKMLNKDGQGALKTTTRMMMVLLFTTLLLSIIK